MSESASHIGGHYAKDECFVGAVTIASLCALAPTLLSAAPGNNLPRHARGRSPGHSQSSHMAAPARFVRNVPRPRAGSCRPNPELAPQTASLWEGVNDATAGGELLDRLAQTFALSDSRAAALVETLLASTLACHVARSGMAQRQSHLAARGRQHEIVFWPLARRGGSGSMKPWSNSKHCKLPTSSPRPICSFSKAWSITV